MLQPEGVAPVVIVLVRMGPLLGPAKLEPTPAHSTAMPWRGSLPPPLARLGNESRLGRG